MGWRPSGWGEGYLRARWCGRKGCLLTQGSPIPHLDDERKFLGTVYFVVRQDEYFLDGTFGIDPFRPIFYDPRQREAVPFAP